MPYMVGNFQARRIYLAIPEEFKEAKRRVQTLFTGDQLETVGWFSLASLAIITVSILLIMSLSHRHEYKMEAVRQGIIIIPEEKSFLHKEMELEHELKMKELEKR